MRRAGALLLLLVVIAAALWLLRPLQPAPLPAPPPPPAPVATDATAANSATAPAPAAARTLSAAPVRVGPEEFARRLRCVDERTVFRSLAAPEIIAVLCAGRLLEALKVEIPRAETGDVHAVVFVAAFAREPPCGRSPPASFARHRANQVERAQASGADPETLRRLDYALAAEQRGPTAEERAACSQATQALPKLQPVLQQAAAALGNPRDITYGDDVDAEIAFDRKVMAAGDSNVADALADALLRKDTPESQTEAMMLLRDAAKTSPSAKTRLARCLLDGCPTPATETDEASQLLTAAASDGDLEALRTLAGETIVSGGGSALEVPVTERYAWGELLHSLQAEGCFGSMFFGLWATSPRQASPLSSMSPADADAAQARARELLSTQFDKTRAQLGCD